MKRESYAVRILDMAHYPDSEHEMLIEGFPSLVLATEYARRRVWASVEECRSPNSSREQIRRSWWLFGEDAIVIGGDYAGSHEIDFFVDHPAGPVQRDWKAIARLAGIERRG